MPPECFSRSKVSYSGLKNKILTFKKNVLSTKIRSRDPLDLPLSFLIFGQIFTKEICKFCEDQIELADASENIIDRFRIIKGEARDPPERWEAFPGT